jgi:hypothetical protein
MALEISYNKDEFRKKVRMLFEGVESEAYDKLKQAATDIQDAVATITTAEALKADGAIDDDAHQSIEAKGLEDLNSASGNLETATDEFTDKEAEEGNPDVNPEADETSDSEEGETIGNENPAAVKPEGDGIPPVEADAAVPGEPVGGEEGEEDDDSEEDEENQK